MAKYIKVKKLDGLAAMLVASVPKVNFKIRIKKFDFDNSLFIETLNEKQLTRFNEIIRTIPFIQSYEKINGVGFFSANKISRTEYRVGFLHFKFSKDKNMKWIVQLKSRV